MLILPAWWAERLFPVLRPGRCRLCNTRRCYELAYGCFPTESFTRDLERPELGEYVVLRVLGSTSILALYNAPVRLSRVEGDVSFDVLLTGKTCEELASLARRLSRLQVEIVRALARERVFVRRLLPPLESIL